MPLPIKFVYAELTPNSINLLQEVLKYKYPVHFGSYVTLDWSVDFELYKDIIGKKFELVVDTLCFDDKIEAIPVNLINSGLRSVNKNPHITWSAIPTINPYYSNYMLYVSDQKINFKSVTIKVKVKADYF